MLSRKRLTCPPKQIPKESTSAGRTIWCMTTLLAAIETISSFPSSCRGQLAGSTTLPCMQSVRLCGWSYCSRYEVLCVGKIGQCACWYLGIEHVTAVRLST